MTSSARLTSAVGYPTGNSVRIPLRILVVDDHRDSANSLAEVLRRLGHLAWTAYDGPTGLAAVQRWRPDVVIVDLGMPLMDGYEVARRIRREPCGADTLLIALTGWAGEEYRVRSAESGFDHYFIKPMALGLLIGAIGEFAAADP